MQGVCDLIGRRLVQAMGMKGIFKSQVSQPCGEIDGRVKPFLDRPIEGNWPDEWTEATYVCGPSPSR